MEFFVPYLGLYSADFVPPPPELVEDLVDDLIAFSNDDVLAAVAQAGGERLQRVEWFTRCLGDPIYGRSHDGALEVCTSWE